VRYIVALGGVMKETVKTIEALTERDYPYGFVTAVEADSLPPGLSEDVIRLISAKKSEPPFMLDWRLRAYRHWTTLERAAAEPRWANVTYAPIDYQNIVYYSAPKKPAAGSLDEVDPEILRTFEKLGIPLDEQKRLTGVAVDAVFDSVSVATTFQDKLAELGSSSARSRKRSSVIPSSSRSIWGRSSHIPTTSSPP
jgi:Fe-S cluster assembly protein SufB